MIQSKVIQEEKQKSLKKGIEVKDVKYVKNRIIIQTYILDI